MTLSCLSLSIKAMTPTYTSDNYVSCNSKSPLTLFRAPQSGFCVATLTKTIHDQTRTTALCDEGKKPISSLFRVCGEVNVGGRNQEADQWEPPLLGSVKINGDGAYGHGAGTGRASSI